MDLVGNLDRQLYFLFQDSVTLARVALFSLHSTSHAVLADVTRVHRVFPGALASLTDHVVSCLFYPVSVASLADKDPVIRYSLLHTSDGLREIDLGFNNNVTSPNLADTE